MNENEENQTVDDETTDQTVDQQTTENAVAAESGAAGAEAPKLSDVLDEAISDASKPRSARPLVSKAEETPEAKEAALKAAKEATAKEDADMAEKGQVRGPDGKFREMTAEEKAAKEAASKKQPDPVNDPLEKGLSERTSKRFQDLIGIVKEQEKLIEGHTALFDAVRGTGASPDEFAQMIQYMTASRSDNPQVLEAAYKVLQGELKGLAIKLGKPIPEVNLLTDPANKDLVDEIREGKITSNRAHEIAVAREAAKTRGAQATQRDQTRQSEQERQQAAQQGKTDLDALEVELIARDGEELYKQAYDLLVPSLQNLFGRIDPREWKGEFTAAYNALLPRIKAASSSRQVTPAVLPADRQQPMRPKQPAGSNAGAVVTAPKSALDAINQALGV